ncbi:MAG: DUF4878 domain-containing protein [Bacteroidales bacterium]|jgi:hypothetical protein|nr:DUF4878 domain-containing protein [Bacteroidales bacterium]
MKELSLITVLLTLFIAFMFSFCGGKGKRPADISMSLWEYTKKGDYKKAAEVWYDNAAFDQDAPAEFSKKETVDMLALKLEESQADKSKIKDVRLVGEEIDKKAGTAFVTILIIYDDGTEEETIDNYIKVDGAWKIDMGKK